MTSAQAVCKAACVTAKDQGAKAIFVVSAYSVPGTFFFVFVASFFIIYFGAKLFGL